MTPSHDPKSPSHSLYGYRLGKGAKDAVSGLAFQLQYGVYGYIVEADVKSYFDSIDHGKLIAMLEKRINDRAFIRLITKWLKAGILEPDGYVKHPVTGTPQGGIVSPVLSNLLQRGYQVRKEVAKSQEPTEKLYMGEVQACA